MEDEAVEEVGPAPGLDRGMDAARDPVGLHIFLLFCVRYSLASGGSSSSPHKPNTPLDDLGPANRDKIYLIFSHTHVRRHRRAAAAVALRE